jgi:predicted transposase YbfD/YdcC
LGDTKQFGTGSGKTQEKPNEITAIPELLGVLSLKDSLVSIDAMECQKDIAEKIVAKEGDYLLTVNDNQSALKGAIEATFSLRKQQAYIKPKIDFHEQIQSNRDREEVRGCWTTISLSKFEKSDDWKELNQIALVETERTIHGKTSLEKRYYICSARLSAEEIISFTHNHWDVENKLHWVLDMAFREDECRVRKDYGA